MKIKRVFEFDLIRALAAIMVVAIHTDAITASSSNYLGGISWWMANIINSISRSAVPLFVMLSGSLVLKTYQVNQNLKPKIVSKLLIPAIFWIGIYFLTQYKWHGVHYNVLTLILAIINSSIGHLYYLYIAIGLYLITPFLSSYLIKIKYYKKIYLLILSIFLNAIFLLTRAYNPFITIFLVWFPYIPLYLLGSEDKNRLPKYYAVVLIITGTLINASTNYYGNLMLTSNQSIWWMSRMGNYFWDTLSPSTILITYGIWEYLRNTKFNFPKLISKSISRLSSSSYGIYLSHPFIIWLVDHYGNLSIHQITGSLWAYYLAKLLLILTISWLFVEMTKKVKYLKAVIGEKS